MSALMISGLLAIWFAPQATSDPPRAGVVPPVVDANPIPPGSGSHDRILGSISGTTPGISFNGVNLPLNYDLFMLITALDANSGALPGFAKVGSAVRWASDPTHLEITP